MKYFKHVHGTMNNVIWFCILRRESVWLDKMVRYDGIFRLKRFELLVMMVTDFYGLTLALRMENKLVVKLSY